MFQIFPFLVEFTQPICCSFLQHFYLFLSGYCCCFTICRSCGTLWWLPSWLYTSGSIQWPSVAISLPILLYFTKNVLSIWHTLAFMMGDIIVSWLSRRLSIMYEEIRLGWTSSWLDYKGPTTETISPMDLLLFYLVNQNFLSEIQGKVRTCMV